MSTYELHLANGETQVQRGDFVDDRPALFDDLFASSIAAGLPKALVIKADHARTRAVIPCR